MKHARLLVLGVALGAGLLAARMVMTRSTPEPLPMPAPEAVATETEEVLVASRDINLGGKLNPSDLSWSNWPKDSMPKGVISKAAEPGAMETYAGQIAKSPIYEGEPIRPQRLVNTDRGFMAAILPKGKRAIAVRVEAETTAGGFILPGDKVDLILTKGRENQQSGPTSETILENVRVLAIDTTTAGEQDEKNLDPKRTATLELTPEEAEIVAQAQQAGTISLALRSAQDSSDDAQEEVRRNRGGVNFVKYGISSQAAAK
ncbi:Flp pilus assembly protein CpaB [Roseibium litorale]|uniref:Flp pilus assembly protein CpaB n=1 Tax=Roseibium litorale TaxID=2803841 RepID=A0ABR9CN78_9HYPH|nr:Flp pilus assembly protein CpaB [Roseibium litorale]MBD8892325.1 Flp pilus assembly protein CpaB [Roseibium litorale]